MVLVKVRPVSLMNCEVSAPSFASDSGVRTIDPTLKPYQPTQSRPAPSMVSVRLCGRSGSRGQPTPRPISSASTRPATPALMWTAVPPA